MYFPFLKGKKRCKRSAEIRRRNCAPLPAFSTASPHNGASAFGERFCFKRKCGKCGNTGCISHFSHCTIGTKDPAKAEASIVRCCLKEPYRSESFPKTGPFRPVFLFLPYRADWKIMLANGKNYGIMISEKMRSTRPLN